MNRFDVRLRPLPLPVATLVALAVFLPACGQHDAANAPEAAEPAPPPQVAPVQAAAPPVLDYEMANQAAPIEGVVTGGQPTGGDLEKLASRGFKTVISLRTEGESGTETEREQVEALGMRFVRIPIAGPHDLNQASAEGLAKTLADTDLQPLLLHCGSSNRVGALVALEAFHARGISPEEALALGKSAGLGSLETVVRMNLGLDEAP